MSRAEHYAKGIVTRYQKPCKLGECLVADAPGARVVNTLQTVKKQVDALADELEASAAAQLMRSQNSFQKLKEVVLDPWRDANDVVDDYLNQLTNGGPPLELGPKP